MMDMHFGADYRADLKMLLKPCKDLAESLNSCRSAVTHRTWVLHWVYIGTNIHNVHVYVCLKRAFVSFHFKEETCKATCSQGRILCRVLSCLVPWRMFQTDLGEEMGGSRDFPCLFPQRKQRPGSGRSSIYRCSLPSSWISCNLPVKPSNKSILSLVFAVNTAMKP